MNLQDKITSIKFYDNKYSKGYIDKWDIEKNQIVSEIIKSLKLPEHGEALDFGCGTGPSTDAIKKALPNWAVYGVDISSVAIKKAKKRCPDCTFFVSSDKDFKDKKFDFLLTHHALEHVYNLSEVMEEINRFMKSSSSFLHILPCGNEGSFEHAICLLKKDGINKEMGDRFFFEDIGHLRRLNTGQMNLLVAKYGFKLTKEYYANQYYGTIEWITRTSPKFVLTFASPKNAKDMKSAIKLASSMIWLLLLNLLRRPASALDSLKGIRTKRMGHYLMFTVGIVFYPISQPLNLYLKNKAKKEWESRKNDKNGSEMYLYYTRFGH